MTDARKITKNPAHTTRCVDPAHRKYWHVVGRNRRCSAFDGYQVMWSPNSDVRCPVCLKIWRTGAKYVNSLPDAPKDWVNAKSVKMELKGEHDEVMRSIGHPNEGDGQEHDEVMREIRGE